MCRQALCGMKSHLGLIFRRKQEQHKARDHSNIKRKIAGRDHDVFRQTDRSNTSTEPVVRRREVILLVRCRYVLTVIWRCIRCRISVDLSLSETARLLLVGRCRFFRKRSSFTASSRSFSASSSLFWRRYAIPRRMSALAFLGFFLSSSVK